MEAEKKRTRLLPAIRDLGLEQYAFELEVDGLTVVPPEVTGVDDTTVDRMVDLLLAKSEELIGCKFSLDKGPHQDLKFHPDATGLAAIDKDGRVPTQFLIQQLTRIDRVFRDLAINPVAIALIRHLIGPKATRFSSHNSFIKWQGEFGYGPTLGLHCDQTALPLPWGRAALTSNTNWCLTDYTLDGGALAYVPGSHRRVSRVVQPQAASEAVPVEAAKGSVIVFHGATWHGAFPRKLPGMRISVANYYRHYMVSPQEDIQGSFPRDLVNECNDPDLFKELAGLNDGMPYKKQSYPLPELA